jgi:hypothetical protein
MSEDNKSTEKNQDNTISLAEKKAAKNDDNPKRSRIEKYSDLTAWLDNNHNSQRFRVIERDNGLRNVVFVNANNVCSYWLDKSAAHKAMQMTRYKKGLSMSPNEALEAFTYWKAMTTPIEEPAIIRMYDDPGLCFNRVPFKTYPGQTPLFEEFLSRASNSASIEAFIGSIFVPKSDNHQYLWLYGDGLNGKSALIRFLCEVLGSAAICTEPPASNKSNPDRFWNFQTLLGRRLVIFPDCNDAKFPSTQKFKMISGGDKVTMEPKREFAFSAKINCKFMFASNEEPEIGSSMADRRRIIYSKLEVIPNAMPDPQYQQKLWMEAPCIIHRCIEKYHGLCPSKGVIPTQKEQISEVIEDNELWLKAVLEQHFCTFKDPNGKPLEVSATKLLSVLRDDAKLSATQIKQFYKFLQRGIASKIHTMNGNKWTGIRVSYPTMRQYEPCMNPV